MAEVEWDGGSHVLKTGFMTKVSVNGTPINPLRSMKEPIVVGGVTFTYTLATIASARRSLGSPSSKRKFEQPYMKELKAFLVEEKNSFPVYPPGNEIFAFEVHL